MTNDELLALFDNLRVADVRDGLDKLMMHATGSMSPQIKPLWRGRACGVALTVRYLPYQGNVPTMSPEQYAEWTGWYYREVCSYPWQKLVQPGSFVVIDQSGVDAGLLGSNNTLKNLHAGARGFVTNGGVRDTDEIVIQRIPCWSAFCSQSMVQARLQFDGVNVPVACGGVTVCPGDVVVGDGDGVVVVPRKIAPDVARWAREESNADRASRRETYQAMARPLDDTVAE